MNAHRLGTLVRRRHLVAFIAALLASLILVCGLASSTAQSPDKEEREMVEKIPKHIPIKVKVKKPEKLKDVKNEDWLGELELEVTNTGTKPIYFLEIVIDMPDVLTPNGLNIAYPLRYGRGALIAFSEPVRPDDVPIQPGKAIVLKVRTDEAEGWKRGRVKSELTNPKRVEFFFQQINFGDGTGFIGTGGVPIPNTRKQGANAPCVGGDDHAEEAASVLYPPRSYFPDMASLATSIPQPASLVPAFFLVNLFHPPQWRGRTSAARLRARG